jgi:putative ABC transport system permease protein
MQLPPGNPISVNWEVLVFTLVLAIVTSVLFGLVPAWKASRLDLNEVLKQAAPAASRAALSHRTSRNLVVAEIALSLIVLVAAGLLVQSMIRLTTVPLGYKRHGLLTADISLPTSSYSNAADWMRFWDRLGLKLGSLPGVQGVAFAPSLATSYGTGPVTIDEHGSSPRIVSASGPEPVSSTYFHVTGVPLLQGRMFSDLDRSGSIPVAVVNVAFATRFFPNGALGQRIKFGKPDAKTPWLTIVGVVGNVSRPTLYMGYSQEPCIYRPLRQNAEAGLAMYVRTTGNPRAAESEIARAVIAVDNNLPVPTVQTVDESLAWYVAEPQFRAELFSVFSALALLLAAVGIYGVLSRRVSERIQEIGVRLALGAQRRDIIRMILGEGLLLVLIGLAIGAAGALGLTRFVRSLLFEIKPTDPATFVAVSLILASVALLACYIPARRAMRVDPMVALRYE